VPLPDLSIFNQHLPAFVSRDDSQDKTFIACAGAASPECRGSVFFAC
jgi:hypothetical protein